MNYRMLAKDHLKRAEDELGSNDDARLKYAALELRMAIEAITYDRAVAYKEEFPVEEYETWQPKRVMAILLEIDPLADTESELSINFEDGSGEKIHLGKESIFSMKNIKNSYDALGSYLHLQTIKKYISGESVDIKKQRNKCVEILGNIKKTLESPVSNIRIGSFSSMECLECNNKIIKRVPANAKSLPVKCGHCKAEYVVTIGDGKAKWELRQFEVSCANEECGKKICVLSSEIEVGRSWNCEGCNGENTFCIGVSWSGHA